MTQAGPVGALPWDFELGKGESVSLSFYRGEAVRHEAGVCREPHLCQQEGSSSAGRRNKLTEAETKSEYVEIQVLVFSYACTCRSSFDYSLMVLGAASGARPPRFKSWLMA